MRSALQLCLALLVATVWSGTVSADDRDLVTFEEALELAARDSLDVKVAEANASTAEAMVDRATSAYWPTLTANVGAGTAQTSRPLLPPPDAPQVESTVHTISFGGTLRFTLWDFGQRAALVASADAGARQSRAEVEAQRRFAQVRAAQIYLTLIATNSLLEFAREDAERMTRQARTVRELARRGRRADIDAQRMQMEAAAAEQRADGLAAQAAALSRELAVAIGRDPARGVAPAALVPDRLAIDLSEAQARRLALRNDPRLKSAHYSVGAADADSDAAFSALWPVLAVQGEAQYAESFVAAGQGLSGTSTNLTASVGLSWDVVDVTRWQQVRASGSVAERQRVVLERVRQALLLEVTQAVLNATASDARYDAALRQRQAATSSREATERRYEHGLVGLLEVLDAQRFERQAAETETRIELERSLAQVRLRSLTTGI